MSISDSRSVFLSRRLSRRRTGRQGPSAALTNAGIPVNSVTSNLLHTLWPTAAVGPARATVDNYSSNFPEYGYSYNGLAKIDYTINDRNSLTAHWFVGQGNQVAPVSGLTYCYYEVAPIHVQNYAMVYNHVFTPSMTNQLLAGVNYFNQVFNDFNNSFDAASLGLDTGSNLNGSPNIVHFRLRSSRRDTSRGT